MAEDVPKRAGSNGPAHLTIITRIILLALPIQLFKEFRVLADVANNFHLFY
jgi:hypothetical protein